MPDGSTTRYRFITKEPIDIITSYQLAGSDDDELKKELRVKLALAMKLWSMFTYNTMQTFIGVVGMQHSMVSPASEDTRRANEFPNELIKILNNLIKNDIKPRDIVTRESIRNAIIVSMAVGGSTNVMLHAPELARAGYKSFANDIMSPDEFNHLSEKIVPVVINARPFGEYSMVDIDDKEVFKFLLKTY